MTLRAMKAVFCTFIMYVGKEQEFHSFFLFFFWKLTPAHLPNVNKLATLMGKLAELLRLLIQKEKKRACCRIIFISKLVM